MALGERRELQAHAPFIRPPCMVCLYLSLTFTLTPHRQSRQERQEAKAPRQLPTYASASRRKRTLLLRAARDGRKSSRVEV